MAPKTIAFFGASGGVGLSALRHSLAAGHDCVALCRDPSKLTAVLPLKDAPNLKIVQGNVHDVEAVARCLQADGSDGRLVDEVVFTVGGRLILSKLSLDDPHVCERGMATVLQAIAALRKRSQQPRQGGGGGGGEGEGGGVGSGNSSRTPRIVACSTTGLSRLARDVPLPMVPLYHVGLKVPHADKRIMEDELIGSGEAFTIVRPSLLHGDGDGRSGSGNGEPAAAAVRAGIEDPKSGVVESKAIGYSISREDAGRWIARNLVLEGEGEGEGKGGYAKYLNKIVTITY